MKILTAIVAMGFAGLPVAAEHSGSPRRERPATAVSSTSYSEVYRSIIIEAGKSVSLDSAIDFANADRVMISFRCTTCDSTANSMNNLVIQAFWTVPEAETYTVAESLAGSAFPYWDSGGVVCQVYGSTLRLTLTNKSTQGMMIQQIVIFRRAP